MKHNSVAMLGRHPCRQRYVRTGAHRRPLRIEAAVEGRSDLPSVPMRSTVTKELAT